MDYTQALSLYNQIDRGRVYAVGGYNDVYKVDDKVVLVGDWDNDGYKEISDECIANGVSTPKVHFEGIIDDKYVMIQDHAKGDPIYFRSKEYLDAYLNCKCSDKEFSEFNDERAQEVADTAQDTYNKFALDISRTNKIGLILDIYPENFLLGKDGFEIIDLPRVKGRPLGMGYVKSALKEILTSGCYDAKLKKAILGKCAIAIEKGIC